MTVHRGYEFKTIQSSSPPRAEQLEDMSVMGWSLVTILHLVETKGLVYLTYLSRPKRVH